MSCTVAVIGLGRIGALWENEKLRQKPATHLGAWLRMAPEVELKAVVDSNPDVLYTAGKMAPDAHWLVDYTELFDMTPDIISVATPLETHWKIVVDLAQHRACKLIFCEKPLARNAQEANIMIEACRKYGVKLAVNHSRRWDVVYQEARKEVAGNGFGHMLRAVAYYSGDHLNVGTHLADVLNWYNLPEERTAVFNLEGEYLIFELDVFLERGRVSVWDNGRVFGTADAKASDFYEGISELKPNFRTRRTPEDPTPMQVACRQLVDCLKTGTQPWCTGEDGLEALRRAMKWKYLNGRCNQS